VDCTTGATLGGGAPTASAEGLVLSSGQYQYDWKTVKTWARTCRELVLEPDDGSVHTATIQFK
jgi:hypothetical protein